MDKATLSHKPPPKPGTVVIADEAHLLKGNRTWRHRRFAVLARAVRSAAGQAWALTGTPVLNRQDELWNVLDAVGIAEETFGSKREFMRLTGAYCTQYGVEYGRTRPEVPRLLQRCTLMRRRLDVLPDLPTKIHREITVECLDDAVRALADKFAELARKAGIEIETASLEQLLELLKQPVAFELISKLRAALAKAKTGSALELVEPFEDAGEPVVVFSAHRAPVAAFGARPGWATITGDTPAEDRTKIAAAFQDGKLRGLAGTIKAMGEGLTLTRAHQMIFVDREWTPGRNTQAEDRICRIGQDRGCIYTTLAADHPVDARLAEILTTKDILIETTVNASARSEVEEQLQEELETVAVKVEATRAVARTNARVSVPQIHALLWRARETGIAQPSIRVSGIQFSMTGAQSKYPGSIYVTDGKGRGGAWWGWIDRTKVWTQRGNPPAALVERIRAYDADTDTLVRDAVSWGKETGSCSFCGRELTDARSVGVGYGPDCAARYGLPHGDAALVGSTRVDGWLERGW